ncbi:MAG: TrkA family potassium uptake protein [Dehalococcoidia bacterium]|nr:MAG: TrkA family potassium uptake protein [Dehalococcoidia bacterium]
MYIIVVGGGKVGYYLSKTLLSEGHEVLILEKDAKKCEAITEELGSVIVRGDGCEARTLADAGTERADMLIAVTNEDEDNLVACQVAKYKFKVPRTIARINNPKNERIFKKLGIDVTVSSTNLILEHIEEEVPTHPLVHLLTLKGGSLEIVEVKIPQNSSVAGKRMKEIDLPPGSVICLMIGKWGAQVPSGDTILEAEAQVIAVTRPEAEEALRAALTGS